MSAASIKSLYLSLKNEITNTCTRLENDTLYDTLYHNYTIHYKIHYANESNLMEIYIEIDVEGETADTDSIVCLLLIHKFKKD